MSTLDTSAMLQEPLKSVTLIKIPKAEEHLDGSPGDTSPPPFHITCSEALDFVFCSVSSDGQVVVFPDGSPPHMLDVPLGKGIEVTTFDQGPGSELFVCTTSPSGGSVRRFQIITSHDGAATVKTGAADIVCGSIGRGFVDGPRDGAMLHTPSLCTVFVDPTTQRPSIVAIADRGNCAIRLVDVRRRVGAGGVDSYGAVKTISGCGVPGYNDGTSHEALLRDVTGLLWTNDGDIIFSDGPNHAIRVVKRLRTSDDIMTDTFETSTLVGGHAKRTGDDDGALQDALLHHPCGLSTSPVSGVFFVADSGNSAVRLVDLNQQMVSTVASIADYEEGSPVPQGLVNITQVVAVTPRGSQASTHAPGLAVLCSSRAQRTVSMIVASSLPFPPRRFDTAGVVSVGRMYDQCARHFSGSLLPSSTNLLRRVRIASQHAALKKVPHGATVAPLTSLGENIKSSGKKSAAYLDIELARRRRDDESLKRGNQRATSATRRSRSRSAERSRQASQSPRKQDVVTLDEGLPSNGVAMGTEAPAVKNMRLLFEAHASHYQKQPSHSSHYQKQPSHSHVQRSASLASIITSVDAQDQHGAAGDDDLYLRKLHFWNFCVTAELLVPANTPAPQSDLIDALYAKSKKLTGYKTTSRMDFASFCDCVVQLVPGGEDSPTARIAKIEQVVQRYCVNAQSVNWETKQLLLDIVTANEVSLRKIFDAYTNEISRQSHVGRMPYLRFQSLLHTLHIFPSLITQARLKELFEEALSRTIFAPSHPRRGSSLPPAASSPRSVQDSKAPVTSDTWKTGSLNLFQFIEGLIRVGWHCFGVNGKTSRASEALPHRLGEPGISGGESVLATVDLLFRWINVEIETMEPSTAVATRHRMANNEACAVFPPKVPLFEYRGGKSCSSRPPIRAASMHVDPTTRSQSTASHQLSPRQLERELRRLRRQQDSVDIAEVTTTAKAKS